MGMTTVYLASQSPRRRQLLEQLSASMGFRVELLAPHPGEDAEALEAVLPSEQPKDYVQRVTDLKLQAGIARLEKRGAGRKSEGDFATEASANALINAINTPKATSKRPAVTEPHLVLASDTTVAVEDEILGKPIDAEDARRMLKRLSGRSHWVHTAVAVAWAANHDFITDYEGLETQRASETRTLTPEGKVSCKWQVKQLLSSSQVHFAELNEAWINWVIQTGEPMDKAGAYAIQGHAASMIKRVEGSPTGIMGLPLHETAELLRHAQHQLRP
jgi:septum formation protein